MIKINSKEELLELDEVIFEEDKRVRINHYGVFYLQDNQYPKYFEYCEPWDFHFCGTWAERTKEEYIASVKEEIVQAEATLKSLQEKLKNA